MDERVIQNLLGRLDRQERRSTRLRYGRVSDIDPLSVTVGDAPAPFTDVGTLASGLVAGDYVAVLASGNDLLVLDRVGGSNGGGVGATGPEGPQGPEGPTGATGAAGAHRPHSHSSKSMHAAGVYH
jgi:hypothetical protein